MNGTRLPIKRTRRLQLEIEKLEKANPILNLDGYQQKWDKASGTDKIKVLAEMLGLKMI